MNNERSGVFDGFEDEVEDLPCDRQDDDVYFGDRDEHLSDEELWYRFDEECSAEERDLGYETMSVSHHSRYSSPSALKRRSNRRARGRREFRRICGEI